MNTVKIVVLRNSLKYLRKVLIFPPENETEPPSRYFYFKYYLLILSTVGLVMGSTLHLMKNIIEQTYINTDLDLAVDISLVGCYWFNLYYIGKVENTVKLYKKLSDFAKFEKPEDFDEHNEILDKLSFAHLVYVLITVGGITVAPSFEIDTCELENKSVNSSELCGIFGAAWWPVDISPSPYKQIYYAYQIYSAYITYCTSSAVSCSIMETIEHVVVRFRHVKRLLQLALSAKNPADRRKSFVSAIEYHKTAICMSEMVNDSFEGCMFVHIFLTAGVLGCTSYRMVKRFSLSAACLFIGYMFSAVMVCFVGQRLINESISVGSAVYSTSWYDLEQSLQKDIRMIILRSQKPLSLKGGPFGIMNYSLLLTILKTSYTYLTLLNRTNNRQ